MAAVGRDLNSESFLDRVPLYFFAKLIKQDDLEILNDLARYLESLFKNDATTLFLLYNSKDETLSAISAPSRPPEFLSQVQNLKIGPDITTCGQAIHSKKPVFSPDIETDPVWQNYLELIRPYKIKSVWSFPVSDSKQNIVGTFVLNFSRQRSINEEESQLMAWVVQIAGLTMERYQQREAEKKLLIDLAQSKERLNLALRARNLGVFDWDIVNNILLWDNSMYDLYGVEKDKFKSDPHQAWQKALFPGSLQEAQEQVYQALQNKGEFDCYFKILKNGALRIIHSTGLVKENENGEPIRMVGVNWDITDKILSEQNVEAERAKTIAASKMASLGEMASGIAHEINNPLTIILARTTQAKNKLQKNLSSVDKIIADLEKVESTVHRIAKIVRGLKSFSRNGDIDPCKPTPVSQIIDETLELCRMRFLSHGIELRMLGGDNAFIDCRSTQISQVILNLLNNSFDAVFGLKELQWVSIEWHCLESHLKIIVSDSGPGISPKLLDQIMVPFFTTKENGKGTGLGLSISRGIIEDHGGKIYVDTKAANTVFVVELPYQHIPKLNRPSSINFSKVSLAP